MRQIGQFDDARVVWEKCLTGRECTLDFYSRDDCASLNNIGIICKRRGEYTDALQTFSKALSRRTESLGAAHPDTLDTVMNITIIYLGGLNKYGGAEERYFQVLDGCANQLGEGHKSTWRCAENLAVCYAKSSTLFRKT